MVSFKRFHEIEHFVTPKPMAGGIFMTKSVQTHPVLLTLSFHTQSMRLLTHLITNAINRFCILVLYATHGDSFNTYSRLSAPGADHGATQRHSIN